MKSIVYKVFAASVTIGAAMFSLGGTAGASHVQVDLSAPEQPAIGQPGEIRAEFHSVAGGAPVAGMTVTFHEQATLAGVTGDTELGQAVTDENGIATLTYEPRTAGDHEIHVSYASDGGEAEDAATTFSVPATGQQLYQSTAGVKIPGLNVWLLMGLVATVWAILLSVAGRVITIARAGADAVPEAFAASRSDVRADARAGSAGGR